MNEEVVLVDEDDNEIGVEEKIKAHKEGKLHRAFSIFIFNSRGEMLLQKRARNKYHSGGLWSNACCSHPKPGESLEQAVHRRLKEEMGFDCDLKRVFYFIYKADLNNEFTEYELDHVFIGKYDGEINPNRNEVEDWKWISINDLKEDIKQNPNKYTVWFKIVLDKVISLIPK
ncbi:MAG: isopentenyl-diphosphate Delta-isomerase [Candidatus Methanomethylicia archaeon]